MRGSRHPSFDNDSLEYTLRIRAEALRRQTKIRTPTSLVANEGRYPYIESLFKEEKAFVMDAAKNKAAKCSRRAGKTWTDAAYLIYEAERWNFCDVAYVTLTRINAKKLLWPKLKWLNHVFKLGMIFNNSELTATTRNGSTIHLFGAHDNDDIEKLRGYSFKLVIVDESQSFGPHIDELLDDILEPATLDGDGTIALTGTPNAACVGRFHEVTTGGVRGWSVHEWTLLQNKFLPHAKKWLQGLIDRRGWSWDHPVIQREYLGRWIRSLDQMVYRFREEKNTINGIPDKKLNDLYYVLSIDLGYHDATAMTVGGWNETDPNFYIVDGYKKVGMLPQQIAGVINQFREQYEFTKIVADTGGLGKMIVEEFRVRYGIPIESAEKKAKADFIELCNADLEQGIVKIDTSIPILRELTSQLSVLQWDQKRRKEDPRYANDFADSFLYNWREGKQYASEKLPSRIDPDSPDFMDELEQREAEQLALSRQGDWTEFNEFDPDGGA